MNRRQVSVALVAVACTTSGIAANSCRVNVVPRYLTALGCACGTELTKQLSHKVRAFPQTQGLTLISACGVKPAPEDANAVTGSFHFRGSRSLAGRIRVEQAPAGNLFFVQAAKSSTQWELRFSDEQLAGRSLNIPTAVGCWEAPAKLRVTQVTVLQDLGTDYEGEYIVAFGIDSRAPYEKCKQ